MLMSTGGLNQRDASPCMLPKGVELSGMLNRGGLGDVEVNEGVQSDMVPFLLGITLDLSDGELHDFGG